MSVILTSGLAAGEFVGAEPADFPTDKSKTDHFAGTGAMPNRYQREIDKLAREIATDKAHRTALIVRIDEVTGQLDTLLEQKGVENEKKPSITTGINAIDQNLANIAQLIDIKNRQLASREKQAARQALPSLLQDAIGDSDALAKHRAYAMQRYLVHRTQMEIKQTHEKIRFLQARKISLSKTGEQLSSSLGRVDDDVLQTRQARQELELQFTELSSAIVQKQDRQELLEARVTQLDSAPEMALFSKQQGVLRDPTSGQLRNRFAEPKARGLLKWEGITIAAPLGQQIEAVFDGTVVFADQLQGLGNVAILDHGEGYMSLYGLAELLVVETGQQVLGGDTIATVGVSPGNDESTLYFEIRHNANTLNPEDWLGLQRVSLINEP